MLPPTLPEEQPQPNKWLVTAFGGPSRSFRRLTSNVHHELVDHKNGAEHGRTGYDLGLTLTRRFAKWDVGAGVFFTTKGEGYHFEDGLGTVSHTTVNTYDYIGAHRCLLAITSLIWGHFLFVPVWRSSILS